VAGLGAFELRFHEAEGLAGGKDGLAVLGGEVLAGVYVRHMEVVVEMYLARHDGLFLVEGSVDGVVSCGYSL
jgi:hypothetical protein